MVRKPRTGRLPHADRPPHARAEPPCQPAVGGFTPRRAALLVALMTVAAFANSFSGDFVLDDIHEIAKNPHLAGPLWEAATRGNALPARPLPYLTFAIDRRIWGVRPYGYHLANVAIHVAAALALFDLVRSTLRSPRLRDAWGGRATRLAAAIAILWAVHPLQTQAVTYVYQRIESLTGMLCLVSLAACARASFGPAGSDAAPAGVATPVAPGQRRRWLAASVAAAAGAMASKENAVVLPLLALAYDFLFVAKTPVSVGWNRRAFHAALFATWGVLAAVMASQRGDYQELKELRLTPWRYLLTQSEVILHYLRLAIWPVGQKIDYASWPAASSLAAVWPACLAVGLAVAASAAGFVLRRPWAALGVLFFVALAPTSSVMPVEAVANEHRMYLPLAAVVAAVVLTAATVFDRLRSLEPHGLLADRRLPLAVAVVVAVLLVVLTQQRNALYAQRLGVWYDLLARDQDNFRACQMMAAELDAEGNLPAALAMAERAIRLRADCEVVGMLAKGRLAAGDVPAAEQYLRLGLGCARETLPETAREYRKYGVALATLVRGADRFAEIEPLLADVTAQAKSSVPGTAGADPAIDIGLVLLRAEAAERAGDTARADAFFRDATALALEHAVLGHESGVNAVLFRAAFLLRQGRAAEACPLVRETLAAVNRASPSRRSPAAAQRQALADLLRRCP